MSWKNALLRGLAAVVLLGPCPACSFLSKNPIASQLSLAPAVRRELRLVVSTNGIIEPIDRAIIYAPIDGFVTNLGKLEGDSVRKGEILMRLESKQVTTSLAEARASLLQARLQAMPVLSGPSKVELEAVDAAIAENELQLNQRREALKTEENLLQKDAVTREGVENIRKEVKLLQLRAENLQERKQALLDRFPADQRRLEQDRIGEISRQVELLEQQVKAGTILAPRSGLLYSLAVKAGSFASRGQQLAEVYEPGKVRLRAYVDEPDLGGIARGQAVQIEWDGFQDRQWYGTVVRPADQVVVLGNRSVGSVLCSIDGDARILIPNVNVKVQIVTATRPGALVIPRSCVQAYKGQQTVIVWDGRNTSRRPISLGLVTTQDVEITGGIDEGVTVVTNPAVVPAQ